MRKRCIQKLSNSPKVTEAMSDKWGSTPILRPEDPSCFVGDLALCPLTEPCSGRGESQDGRRAASCE